MSKKQVAAESEGTSSRNISPSSSGNAPATAASFRSQSGLPSRHTATGGRPSPRGSTTSESEKTTVSQHTVVQESSSTTAVETAKLQAEAGTSERPRQVIAVSASKGPAAFFNLARKFLATDEICDLSALEGAIVSAVDAAHLLERSKLATIIRVQTSYVTVEPKRKSQQHTPGVAQTPTTPHVASMPPDVPQLSQGGMSVQQQPQYHQPPTTGTKKAQQGKSKGSPLRRARIIITVKRTQEYKTWLEENPHHLSAGDDDDDDDNDKIPPASATTSLGKKGGKPPPKP